MNRIDPSEIERQRKLGWPDFHPEEYCHRCGHRNLHAWSVASDRWNMAVEALGLHKGTILCPQCFEEGWQAATGMTAVWDLHMKMATWPD